MHVVIKTAALPEHVVSISNAAADAVRMGFNPSAMPRVDAIKALAAALISECDAMRADRASPGAREAAIAITEIEGGAMWAVKAATAAK